MDKHFFWNTLFSPLGGRIASLQTLSRNKLLTNNQQHWLFFRLLYKYLRDKISVILSACISGCVWLVWGIMTIFYKPVFCCRVSDIQSLLETAALVTFWWSCSNFHFSESLEESLCDFHSSVGAITPSLKRPSWCFCPCRVSLRVTRRRRLSARCSSAARTSSSTPPGWSATRTTSNSIYCSAKRPPSEPPPTPPPPAPSPLPPARTSQHHSCLGPPSTQTRAGDQSVLTAGFISLKKLFETRRQSQEFNKVLETQRLFLR